jgi:hypothetical protein
MAPGATMDPDYRIALIAHLADIDKMIREAEVLTTVPADGVLLRASKVLADFQEQRRKVEEKPGVAR